MILRHPFRGADAELDIQAEEALRNPDALVTMKQQQQQQNRQASSCYRTIRSECLSIPCLPKAFEF